MTIREAILHVLGEGEASVSEIVYLARRTPGTPTAMHPVPVGEELKTMVQDGIIAMRRQAGTEFTGYMPRFFYRRTP